MYLDVSGTWIFQKSSLYKYQNKNKQTWNHYLSKTVTGLDSSNHIYCKQLFPSDYQPDTVYIQWDLSKVNQSDLSCNSRISIWP